MNKKIEKLINEYKNNGIVLYVQDNGQPDYFDVKTMCDFAMVDFKEKGNEFVAILLDDGNKRENIISVDQIEELISKQTENRGIYFNDKAEAKRFLDFAFATGELDSDTYDDLVEELNELKF